MDVEPLGLPLFLGTISSSFLRNPVPLIISDCIMAARIVRQMGRVHQTRGTQPMPSIKITTLSGQVVGKEWRYASS